MSRVGKVPVKIPADVKVEIDGCNVRVSGPFGMLSQTFDDSVIIEQSEGEIIIKCRDENDDHSRMMHGTVRSIVNSMVLGVVNGYSRSLEISGVGFKAVMRGADVLDLSLGYSHDVLYKIPTGVKLAIDQTGTKVDISGPDKKVVGQVAADIKKFYPVEPYKGKGVRIVGKFVRCKDGKKTA